MNRRILAYLSLTAFIALAVFGFAAMTGEMRAHGDCLASIANNGCPVPAAGPAVAVFHISAYQAFSTTILSFFAVFLIFLAVWLAVLEIFLQRSRERRDRKLSSNFSTHESVIYHFRRWLSRLEKAVPALVF
ncbi:MAG: hypothetical protein M1275_02590 [Patescibacteria group bacterium]|nr:hypothetical protein [Patescibacteria group bacterium]